MLLAELLDEERGFCMNDSVQLRVEITVEVSGLCVCVVGGEAGGRARHAAAAGRAFPGECANDTVQLRVMVNAEVSG